jgi:hypothetical protein
MLTALDMEIILIKYFNPRVNIIVPNVSWGIANLHECDLLILSKSNYATEIEIKTSRQDLLADKNKKHGHFHNHIARLFFAVPENLVDLALIEIPKRAGLYSIKLGHDPVKIRNCKRNSNCVEWSNCERLKLAHLGTMRILGLKQKIAINQLRF